MLEDEQLLRSYVEEGSQRAFGELVARHVNLVYSAALRRTGGNGHFAKDVAQLVFTDLARKADSLPRNVVLPGWLHQATRFAAGQLLRTERRRQMREQEAVAMNALESEPAGDWAEIRPLLDDALDELEDADRDAVMLRFFEQRSLAQIGQALGATEDAARMRISRALEKLRGALVRRGIATTGAALSAVISANAVQAAPAGVAVTISSAALAGTTLASTATTTAIKTIAMTAAQKTIIGVTLAAAVGTGVYEAHQTSTLRSQIQTLQQQQAPLTEQVQQLTRERDEAKNQLAALQGGDSQLKPNEPSAEVLRLRAEVTQLRQQVAQSHTASANANDPFTQNVLALAGRAATLNQYLEQRPDERIPELRFLSENDWLTAAAEAKSDSETDLRKALCVLRSKAKQRLPMAGALDDFTRANNGQLPTDMSQLTPYLKTALKDINLDDATLEAIVGRYKLVQTGNVTNVPPNAWVIVEKAPVDKVYDSRAKFGIGRSTVTTLGPDEYRAPEDRSY